MADLAWTAWYDEVMPMVPKAPRQFVQNAVRDAARQLCEKGKVYLLDSDPIDIVANTKEYAWAKSGVTNVETTEIWQLFYQGYELDLLTREELRTKYANWPAQTGGPSAGLKLKPSVVRLVPYPSASVAQALTIWAFVRPTRTATGILSDIGERWYYAIGRGARARLLKNKGSPYYDPALAQDQDLGFQGDIAAAALKAELGESDTDLEGETVFF